MTTLKDKLNSAISDGVYRNTRTFATCKRFYRFTKYDSFAFSAIEYDENGDFLNNVTICMDSEDIINLYEDVPKSELPLLLRSSLSQPKCTNNPESYLTETAIPESNSILSTGFYFGIKSPINRITRNTSKKSRDLSKILVGME